MFAHVQENYEQKDFSAQRGSATPRQTALERGEKKTFSPPQWRTGAKNLCSIYAKCIVQEKKLLKMSKVLKKTVLNDDA